MKRKSAFRDVILLLTALLALFACPMPARALAHEDGIRGGKKAVVLDEAQRAFRLDYRVWSDESVLQAAEPCDVILLLDVSAGMSAAPEDAGKESTSRLERMRGGVRAFLRELSETSPESRACLVLFGKEARTAGQGFMDAKGTERLLEALSEAEVQASGDADYAAALKLAKSRAEDWNSGGDRPLYLITVASGQWGEEKAAASLEQLQALRKLGAKSYTLLLCSGPEEKTENFWQSMSSAPLASHHYVCGGEAESCLRQVRRDLASLFTAEVRQELDPRFEIDAQEQARLRRAGAHLTERPDGSWSVSWEADLPRTAEAPWTASLSVQAKNGFPGGNDISVDGEGTGLYRLGKQVGSLPKSPVNVALKLGCTDVETSIFLGEKIRGTVDGESVEDRMRTTPTPVWFGKGQTGTLACLWETSSGSPVGSLEQLTEIRPEWDKSYRLKVTYRPGSDGKNSVGTPVEAKSAEALYRVRVEPGTVRIKAAPGKGTPLGAGSRMIFRVEDGKGRVRTCTARAEADPQTGKLFLQGEVTDLPYGTYWVAPMTDGVLECAERGQLCRLGVWLQDDTVSTGRNTALARFTLREASSLEDGE